MATLNFEACAARGQHRINLLGILRQAVDALAIDRQDAIPGPEAHLGQRGGRHLVAPCSWQWFGAEALDTAATPPTGQTHVVVPQVRCTVAVRGVSSVS